MHGVWLWRGDNREEKAAKQRAKGEGQQSVVEEGQRRKTSQRAAGGELDREEMNWAEL